MKAIKYLFLLIILILLGTLGYQNQDYFMAATPLHINLDFLSFHYSYTAKALPNVAYWGICFGLGLLIIGMRGLFTAFRLGREVKEKEAVIAGLKSEINTLKINLNVFTHDPYIKQQKENAVAAIAAEARTEETGDSTGDTQA